MTRIKSDRPGAPPADEAKSSPQPKSVRTESDPIARHARALETVLPQGAKAVLARLDQIPADDLPAVLITLAKQGTLAGASDLFAEMKAALDEVREVAAVVNWQEIADRWNG